MRLLILSIFILLLSLSWGQTYTVTTEKDTVNANDGVVSLREAVASANTTAGQQTIRFNGTLFLPGANRVIYLKKALQLTDNSGVIINGEDGKVTLDGSQIDSNAVDFKNGLVLTGGKNVISHLYLQNFLGSAIRIDSLNSGNNTIGPNNHISKCWGAGILVIDSEQNTITENDIWNCGRDTLRVGDIYYMNQDAVMLIVNANKNTVSGNNIWANYASGIGAYESSQSTISGNFIAINAMDGIRVYQGSGHNTITDNDLLGNEVFGIQLYGGDNSNNIISANGIGDSTKVPLELLSMHVATSDLLSASNEDLLLKTLSAGTGNAAKFEADPYQTSGIATTPPTAAQIIIIGPINDRNTDYGIRLSGGSATLIEHNTIANITYCGIYIEGYMTIEVINDIPDTSYYFPDGITIQQNRLERIAGPAVLFENVLGITASENYFDYCGTGIGGYGIFSYDPVAAGLDSTDRGIFTIERNVFNTCTMRMQRSLAQADDVAVGGTVSVQNAEAVTITDNQISKSYNGVSCYNLDRAVIQNNTLESVYGYGMRLDAVKSITISGNTLTDVGMSMIANGLDKKISTALNAKNQIAGQEGNLAALGAGGIMLSNIEQRFTSRAIVWDNTLSLISGNGVEAAYLTGVTIKQNQLQNIYGTGMYLFNNRRVDVVDNKLIGSGAAGAYVEQTDSLFMQHNVFQDQTNGENLRLWFVAYSEVHHNQFSNAGANGIYTYEVDSVLFTYNVIQNAAQSGIYLFYGNHATVMYNDIYGNSNNGLYAYLTTTLNAKKNNVSRNGASGLWLDFLGKAVANHNNLIENGNSGIQAYACTTAVADSNYFTHNRYGFYTSSFDSLRLRYNSFVKNSAYGVYNSDLDTLDARQNYWGHVNGPAISDTLYPGIAVGDRISENVLYQPFLTAPVVVAAIGPVITAVEPAQSPREGGGAASLRGRQFMPGVQILVDKTAAAKVSYFASDLLGFEIPAGKGGWVDVIVINPGGLSDTLKNGFFYDNHAPLPFDLISPSIPDTVYSPTPDFRWSKANDPDGDAVEYVLMYSLFDTFKDSVYIAGIEDTVYTLEDDSLTEHTTYYWRVLARDNLGGYAISSTRALVTGKFPAGPNSLENPINSLPTTYALYQNYPNPFNPVTTIRYDIVHATHVEVSIFNMLGQKVATLVKEQQKPGRYRISWNAAQYASGVYFYTIRSEHFTKTRKLILLK